MRVWLWQEREYGELGQRRWSVEWYTIRPKARARVEAAEAKGEYDEYYPDCDIECHERAFPMRAKGLALALAKRVAAAADSAYGCAIVKNQVVANDEAPDGYGEWVDVGSQIDVP